MGLGNILTRLPTHPYTHPLFVFSNVWRGTTKSVLNRARKFDTGARKPDLQSLEMKKLSLFYRIEKSTLTTC